MFYPETVDAGMYGEVYIPEHEIIGFYDENETYTVFAGIKNKEYYPIIPTVTITVQDGDAKIVEEYELSTIMPDNMLPMKVQIPEVKSANPILEEPLISYKKSTAFVAFLLPIPDIISHIVLLLLLYILLT